MRIAASVVIVLVPALMLGCRKPPSAATKTKPATVEPIKETQLNTVVLTEDAEKKLGLAVAAVEERAFRRARSYPGEVVLPASALVTVSAPVSGKLKVVKGQELPQVGSTVKAGQTMFSLVPHALTQAEQIALKSAVLSLHGAQVDAEGQVKQWESQVKSEDVNVKRFKGLYLNGGGIKKDVDDAEAKLDLAQKGLTAALEKKKLVDSIQLETDADKVKALVISSPRSGIVRTTFAVPGELVPAGAALFEVMNIDKIWIKVPVYLGELPDIAEGKPAQVNNLADLPGTPGVTAQAVQAPPTAAAPSSSADLYYELANTKGKYRPGEKLSVLVPLRDQDKSLGVPWQAVVTDINGGTWVYEQTAPHTYVRSRVQVRYVEAKISASGDNWAVLAEGPKAGTKIVTAGAAEVFGSEFGKSFGAN
jgi:membrane fusion protein, heavy metal efflux system